MKRYKVGLMVAIMAMMAGHASAFVDHGYEKDSIEVREAGTPQDDKVVVLKAGEEVEFTIPVYASNFFGDFAIFANAEMKNRLDRPVKAIYYISFYNDEDEMIACHQGAWDLGPHEEINYGSGIMPSDPEVAKSVTKYRLRTMVLEDK